MPFTHVDIQKQRKQKTTLLFLILALYYLLSLMLLWMLVHPFLHLFIHDQPNMRTLFRLSTTEIGGMLVIALLTATLHWLVAVSGGVERILTSLHAQPLDPKDRYHRQFFNIVEEARVAVGGRRARPVVLPTLATNAFTIATTEENGVIGVTEGLLARLNRPQLEAVVAHEMAHLFHHDSTIVTMACSLFGVFAQLLRASIAMAKPERGESLLLIWPLLPVLWFLAGGAKLLNMAISRQREYLADATAVQLTNNPTALAETLLKISSAWRGVGALDEALAPIFIANPGENLLDEQDSVWADLFSTHPPIDKRVKILTALARTDLPALDSSIQAQHEIDRLAQAQNTAELPPEMTWWIQQGAVWKGPFTVGQLLTLPTFRPESWICRQSWEHVTQAADDPILLEMISARTAGHSVSSRSCPRCRQALTLIDYEGAQLYECHFCLGHLVAEHSLVKVISRREVGFSDRFKMKVEQFQKRDILFSVRRRRPRQRDASRLLDCPTCQNEMIRNFYTFQYRIIVDRCQCCHLLWFDHEELDMLQVMIETTAVR